MKHGQTTSVVAFQTSQVPQQSDSVVAAYSGGYSKQKNRPICSHCGIAGHTANICYKLYGYPPGYKPQNTGCKMQSQSRKNPNSAKKNDSWNTKKENVGR